MAEFQKQSEAFSEWFKSQPGASCNPNIQLTDLRDKAEGRGIIATSDIPAETELFSIPRRSVISVENSEISRKLPKIFSTLKVAQDDDNADDDDNQEIEMPDPWLDLIMVMLYEYLQGDASAWKPYFDVLPDQFDTLMFWKPEELKELQASAVKDRIGRESADEMFQNKVLPVIKEHQNVFYPSGATKLDDKDVVQLAHRMGSIIMAYAFDLDQEDEDEEDEDDGWVQDADAMKSMGMVPMADMLNADAEFNAHLNHEEEKLTMTSLRVIKAGEEILNYYGPLPRCDLLRRYGYTSDKHARYDVVELPWELIKKSIDEHFGGEQKSTLDEDEIEEAFVLERESGDPDETGVNTFPAEFTAYPEELEEQVNQFTVTPLNAKSGKPDKAVKQKMKAAFAEIMSKSITKRLKQYITTVAEDEQLLKKAETTGRHKMAIDVRLGEKRLLQEAQTYVDGLRQKYKDADQVSGAPSAKRQKTSK